MLRVFFGGGAMPNQEVAARAQLMLPFLNAMHELDITNVELARRMGVTPSYASMLLRGKKNTTIDMLIRLSNILCLVLTFNLSDG